MFNVDKVNRSKLRRLGNLVDDVLKEVITVIDTNDKNSLLSAATANEIKTMSDALDTKIISIIRSKASKLAGVAI